MFEFIIVTIVLGWLASTFIGILWDDRAAIWESFKNDIKEDFTITWFK